MSAAKRRIKRKIAQLVRMGDTRSRMSKLSQGLKSSADIYWETCMMPLAHKLNQMGQARRAIEALCTKRFTRATSGGRP